MIGKKEIYLKAYFRKNVGDDLFVRCVAERYPNVSFRMFAYPAFAKPFAQFHNIRNIGKVGLFIDRACNRITGKHICRQLMEKSAPAVVHIGGSIFIEPYQFSLLNPNTFVIGCNFGPYRTEAYRRSVFSELERAKDVCFRDRYSYEMFSSLNNVRMAPDVLFAYPGYPALQKGHGVGISVMSIDKRPELKHAAEKYYSEIARTLDECARMQIPVKLFSFCEAEGDTEAIREIMARSKTKCAEVCEYDGDMDAILHKLNECEYIVATRFHAMVIGWGLSKKVFPVVYSNKQLNVMQDIGYRGSCWDLKKAEADSDFNLMEHIMAAGTVDVKDCQQHAQEQFEALDRYISEFA
ncbi:MAG: polysaccharide pyruvyl transferase family protein [Oscillospiraceae bacterium]|nr:polysaccharide pyruvyl transferase family protein [Oscillospiraceae bacterium]